MSETRTQRHRLQAELSMMIEDAKNAGRRIDAAVLTAVQGELADAWRAADAAAPVAVGPVASGSRPAVHRHKYVEGKCACGVLSREAKKQRALAGTNGGAK